MKRLGADKYQTVLKNAPKIKVAILDTGIDANHSDLKSVIDLNLSKDFSNSNSYADDHGHGTHVAGTIGAAINGK